MSRKVVEEVAPKLERLPAADGSARELRDEVAGLNDSVEELATSVAEVKRAARAARSRQAGEELREAAGLTARNLAKRTGYVLTAIVALAVVIALTLTRCA